MKTTIKLLKDHDVLGKEGSEVDVTEEQANYLVRVGAAEYKYIAGYKTITKEQLQDFDEAPELREKNETDEPEKEKKEIKLTKEKAVHTGLPTAKKKGRPKKQ